MARLNYKEYFPVNDPKELFEKKIKQLTESDQKKWKNFKNRIPRSSFIKNKLKNRQSNTCPICSNILNNNIVVHHIDYDHLCVSENYQKQKSPTHKNPNRELNVPNCINCNRINPCLDRLVLIHNSCHMILHKQEGRISKGKNKISFPKEKRNYEKVSKEYWINKSTQEILNLSEEILKQINENSKTKFKIEYTKFFLRLTPENIVYFKPEGNYLTVTLSYGEFGKWLKELNQKNIKCKIYKRTNQRLSFTINKNEYYENQKLFRELINDSINKFKNNDTSEYSPQMTLF